jgi:hypothetical protein
VHLPDPMLGKRKPDEPGMRAEGMIEQGQHCGRARPDVMPRESGASSILCMCRKQSATAPHLLITGSSACADDDSAEPGCPTKLCNVGLRPLLRG